MRTILIAVVFILGGISAKSFAQMKDPVKGGGGAADRIISVSKDNLPQPIEARFKIVETISVSTGIARKFYAKFRFRPELIAKSSKMGQAFLDEYSKMEKESRHTKGNRGIILPRYYGNMDPEEFVSNVDYLKYIEEENELVVYNKKQGKVCEIHVEPKYAPACEIADSAAYIFCRLTPKESWEGGDQQLRVYRRSGEIAFETPFNDADKMYFSNNGKYLVYSASAYGTKGVEASYSYVDLDANKKFPILLLTAIGHRDYDVSVCDSGQFSFETFNDSSPDKMILSGKHAEITDEVDLSFLKAMPPSERNRYHTVSNCDKVVRYGASSGSEFIRDVVTKKTVEIPQIGASNFTRTSMALSKNGRHLIVNYYQKKTGQTKAYVYDIQSGRVYEKIFPQSGRGYFSDSGVVFDDGRTIEIWTEK